MKYLIIRSVLITLALGGIAGAKAQSNLNKTHLLPRDGDNLNKSITKHLKENSKGDNCLWNFSNVRSSKIYKICHTEKGDSLLTTEGNNIYYRQVQGDSLFLLGFENTTTKLNYLLPELELKYPIVYGDSISCYFSAIGEYSGQYDMSMVGQKHIVVDAKGVMITPDKDTLYNVIQVRSSKFMAQTTEKIDWDNLQKYFDQSIILSNILKDTAIIKTENIKWFYSGHRYPIFESVRNSVIKGMKEKEFFSSSYYYPPLEQDDLKHDPDNQEILDRIKEMDEKEKEAKWIAYYNRSINSMNSSLHKANGKDNDLSDYDNSNGIESIKDRFNSNSFILNAFYPIPVKDFLHLEYTLPESATIEFTLTDMSGKVIYHKVESKMIGINKTSIDMRPMLSGNYIISLNSMGKSLHENITLKK